MSVRYISQEGLNNNVTAIPDVPDSPTVGAATNVGTSRAFNSGAATVAYTAADTGGAAASFTATSTPGSFTGTGTSPITVTGLQSATSYTFTVRPSNATATGPSSSSSASITATTVPDAPSAPTATNSGSGRAFNNGSASIAFTTPATGGSAISSYIVTSSPGYFTGTGSVSPITVTGQQSATAYTYTVTATNANGTGSASSASSSVTATTVPAAPTIGTFTDGGTGTTGTLSFTAGATGGSAITNYKISTDNITYTALSPTQTSSPLSLTGLSVGTATYYIKAVNTNGDSAASSGVSGTVLTPTSFESIATITGTGSSGTITFSSIPSTYKSLQIRVMSRSTYPSTGAGNTKVQFNGDTAGNYTWHNIWGNGTAVNANANFSQSGILIDMTTPMANEPANTMAGLIIDIMDYSSTSKNKTLRSSNVYNSNAGAAPEQIRLNSGAWASTSALNSITLTSELGNYTTASTFALYGVK
jgi:hypothetical protein